MDPVDYKLFMEKKRYEEMLKKMRILVQPVNKKIGVHCLSTPINPIVHNLTFSLNPLDSPRKTGLFQDLVLHSLEV